MPHYGAFGKIPVTKSVVQGGTVQRPVLTGSSSGTGEIPPQTASNATENG